MRLFKDRASPTRNRIPHSGHCRTAKLRRKRPVLRFAYGLLLPLVWFVVLVTVPVLNTVSVLSSVSVLSNGTTRHESGGSGIEQARQKACQWFVFQRKSKVSPSLAIDVALSVIALSGGDRVWRMLSEQSRLGAFGESRGGSE